MGNTASSWQPGAAMASCAGAFSVNWSILEFPNFPPLPPAAVSVATDALHNQGGVEGGVQRPQAEEKGEVSCRDGGQIDKPKRERMGPGFIAAALRSLSSTLDQLV